jgi:Flp pilus assembly protein TadB
LETDSSEQTGATNDEEMGTGDEETAMRAGEEAGDDSTPDGFNLFRQPWLVVACLLLVASAVLLVLSHTEAAFVTAALGVSAWFWNVRENLKRKHKLERRGGRDWRPRGDDDD